MRKLLLSIVLLPICASAQTNNTPTDAKKSNFYSKTYEVDLKTKEDVNKIAQNFFTENKMTSSMQYGNVVSHFSMPFRSSKLSTTVDGDVVIHAWNGKTMIEITNMKYTLANDDKNCSKTGELSALYSCSNHRIAVADLKKSVDNYTGTIAKKYGVYIDKINSPDGFKYYAYDYGPQAHMKYAVPSKGKKPITKQPVKHN